MASGGRGRRNVAFIQGDEPKFLQEFKQRAGYLAGPALEEKFLGGKIPKRDDEDGSDNDKDSSSDREGADEKPSRKRGFSPTARFGTHEDDRSPSPDRPDEKPLIVKDSSSSDDEDEEEAKHDADLLAAADERQTGQIKSDGLEMSRSLDIVYGKTAKAKVPKPSVLPKRAETVDVEKVVASGGKFVFKKPSDQQSSVDADESEEGSGSAASAAKRWRQDGEQEHGSKAPKKKSESRAVSDRKLLSFDIIDD